MLGALWRLRGQKHGLVAFLVGSRSLELIRCQLLRRNHFRQLPILLRVQIYKTATRHVLNSDLVVVLSLEMLPPALQQLFVLVLPLWLQTALRHFKLLYYEFRTGVRIHTTLKELLFCVDFVGFLLLFQAALRLLWGGSDGRSAVIIECTVDRANLRLSLEPLRRKLS